jgi:UDP-N-acetylglucosamine 1-carboxyvinyltransferase
MDSEGNHHTMRIRVDGRHPLNGVYTPSGATNTALHAIAAALMTDQPVTIHNVAHTASTQAMLELAKLLGAEVQAIASAEANTDDGDTRAAYTLHTPQITRRSLSAEETQGFVGSLLYLAPILARRGYARLEIDSPLSRVRTHLEALRDLGQDVMTGDNAVEIRLVPWGYKDIILSQASVTATSLVLMLASAVGKETIIHNAACEPHIQHLAHLLEQMGVQIDGIGSNVLRVFGVAALHGAVTTLDNNTIEAASVAAIAAMCGGRVEIRGVRQSDLRMIARVYKRLGITLDVDENSLFVPRHEALMVSKREEDQDSSIETAPWPGFPSDLVAMATVIATQARGTSLIHEKLFNDRLLFVDKLNRMGAQIVLCDPHRAIVVGASPLNAIYMDSPDVRIGLGMLGAALVARGETVIDNAQAISRSFDRVIPKLKALGAQITDDA